MADRLVRDKPGTANATTSIVPIEASIASRTPPSSTSIALVDQAYPFQANPERRERASRGDRRSGRVRLA
jgi:hypothetical protein